MAVAGSCRVPGQRHANVPGGNFGAGEYDWQLSGSISPANNYMIRVTSQESSAITGSSQAFAIVLGKVIMGGRPRFPFFGLHRC